LELLRAGERVSRSSPKQWRKKQILVAASLLAVFAMILSLLAPNRKPGLPAKLTGAPVDSILTLVYADGKSGKEVPVAGEKPLLLQFQVMAKRKGESSFRELKDGDALTSNEDEYVVISRTSGPGYIYIFQVDTSGRIDWLYPANHRTKTSSGANPVDSGRIIQVPAAGMESFYLDDTVGVEHIYGVFSVSRWTELEDGSMYLAQTAPVPDLERLRLRSFFSLRPLRLHLRFRHGDFYGVLPWHAQLQPLRLWPRLLLLVSYCCHLVSYCCRTCITRLLATSLNR
jgi:hypothetical protein